MKAKITYFLMMGEKFAYTTIGERMFLSDGRTWGSAKRKVIRQVRKYYGPEPEIPDPETVKIFSTCGGCVR